MGDMLSTYHRRLARARVAHIRRDFRRRLGALQQICGSLPSTSGDAKADEQADRLLRTVLHNLCEVESFISSLGRFFKSVDLSLPYNKQHHSTKANENSIEQTPLSDSSDEKLLEAGGERTEGLSSKHSAASPQPAIDHASAGYIMHIDCGHNGVLDDVDMRQMSLHLRAARFGRSPSEASC